jgi:hypothetical protein
MQSIRLARATIMALTCGVPSALWPETQHARRPPTVAFMRLSSAGANAETLRTVLVRPNPRFGIAKHCMFSAVLSRTHFEAGWLGGGCWLPPPRITSRWSAQDVQRAEVSFCLWYGRSGDLRAYAPADRCRIVKYLLQECQDESTPPHKLITTSRHG